MVNESATTPNESKEGDVVRAVNMERVVSEDPNYAEFYANDTQIQTSVFDVQLMFGVIAQVSLKDKTAFIRRVACVRMSLHHAKSVAALLSEQIRRYEAQVGTLTVPPTETE